jgi:hypothetical protein
MLACFAFFVWLVVLVQAAKMNSNYHNRSGRLKQMVDKKNLHKEFCRFIGLDSNTDCFKQKKFNGFYGHVVEQSFKYVERKQTSEIVKLFQVRVEKRRSLTTHNPKDKIINPLIAIPGAPGIGKSTFLVNFPLSDQYQSFCKRFSSGDVGPIVSTLTFNSGMDEFNKIHNDFPLRILYGAVRAMEVSSILGLAS